MSPRPLCFLFLFSILVSPSLHAQYEGSKPVAERLKAGFDSIESGYCKEVLGYLAGDECQGRKTGTPGYQKAADYVAARFKEFGLKAVGEDGGYFQPVPFPRSRIVADKSYIEGGKVKLAAGTDVNFDAGGGDLKVEVVVVSGGADSLLDDPKILRKHIVLVNIPDGRNSAVRRQMNRDRPDAILYVVESLGPASEAAGGGGRTITGNISKDAATRLLKALGANTTTAFLPPKDGKKALATLVKSARVVVVEESLTLNVPNVVGLLPGSDPALKHEMVICGSHLDHLGVQGDGKICYGADDDGSGSAGLVALARAFTKHGPAPKRSILFLAFCGEELGLVGSKYYTDHPIFPLEDAVCEIQMDMIGRDEESKQEKASDNLRSTHPVGTRRMSSALHDLVLECNKHVGFEFEFDEEGVYTRSDHYNFAKNGVPVAFFFSGFHPDYHKPTDTIDKINFTKLTNTTKLVYLIASHAADRPARLKKDQ